MDQGLMSGLNCDIIQNYYKKEYKLSILDYFGEYFDQ
jgi:hypothetical protein